MKQRITGEMIMNRTGQLMPDLVKIRHYIHAHPEVAYHEIKTSSLVREKLTEIGIELVPIPLETSVIGVIHGTAEGPDVATAFRADMDCNTIQEQNDVEYASTIPGLMHGCGHDGHTTIMLGVAQILNENRSSFSGTVVLIFQAAQETLAGARDICETGVLKELRVSSIITLHAWPYLNVGQIGVWPGQYQSSSDAFTIQVFGKSGHISRPWQARNPVLPASLVVNALNGLVSREINPTHKALLGV